MQELELKKAFAKLLLKISDPFKAALELFPDNTNKALRVAHEWPQDPDVKAATEDLLYTDEALDLLPTKAELAKSIWDKMHSPQLYTDDFTKLGKLYAEVRGFIEKPSTTIKNEVSVAPSVMIVKESSSDTEWESKLKRQQIELLKTSNVDN